MLPAAHQAKHPRVRWEQRTTLPTDAELKEWFGNVALANYWVLCGSVSRVVVLDCDNAAALAWADEHIGADILSRTPAVKTAKGIHYYFRCNGNVPPQWALHEDGGISLDVRSNGGGVIAPPSIHESGVVYQWLRTPDEGFQSVPEALLEPHKPLVITSEQDAGAGLASLLRAPASMGGRNVWLTRVAGHCASRIPLYDGYIESMRLANLSLKPPLSEKEWRATADSIWKAEHAGSAAGHQIRNSELPGERTESAVAHLFARRSVDQLWYVPDRSWFVYEPETGRFVADNDAALALVQKTVERMGEAAVMLGGEEGKAARRFARSCASARGLKAILTLAQIEPSLRLPMSAFDTQRTLINVGNGVLDLETGMLHPHSPHYRMTKLAGCAYDPAGEPEQWLRHLDYIIGDRLEIDFLQRWLGRALSGIESSDNCRILMPIGSGANGKTITVETVAAVLGGYCVATDFPTWCVSYGAGGNPREDLARLGGARLVVTSESGRGHTLDENLIKQYMGGELVSPRIPYARSATIFRPQFSMLISTNHEPRMDDHSDGFWRRFLKIVFGVSIPQPDQDPHLLAKLHEELPKILSWLVEGYQQWHAQGLDPPASVLLATAESRRNSDLVGQFIEENLACEAGAKTELGEIYTRYQLWCEKCGIRRALTAQQLSARLAEHGLQRGQDNRTRRSVLCDIALVASPVTGVAAWLA